MGSLRTMAAALVAASSVVALCGAAVAQTGRTPSQSDFDACNREAEVVRGGSGSPNTSIGSTTPPGTTGSMTPGGLRTSGSPATSNPGAGVGTGTVGGAVSSGSVSGSTGVGSAAGATGGTGSLSGGSTLSGGSSSPTGDVGLRGIASSGGADPAYQQAYRDCLRRRGF
jgi:hypothetical protein